MMCLAYKIVEKVTRKHPFGDEKASRAWLDRLHGSQLLASTTISDEDTINVFLKSRQYLAD